ncbi:MAG: D-alanyl-D-alanine carboxypeptidase [Desulfobacula sp.]|jgi:D-alanyl-D-alanine carboxypeptidase/D-alanyl-D-alanine-endopeptidase (penicillin-binding protein 4)
MTKKKDAVLVVSGLFAGLLLLSIVPCLYAEITNTGIILADDRGDILYAQNKEKYYIPASTLKILTSLAAIHILGEDYHFPVHYDYNQKSKNLYIKGYGDPIFTSEILEDLSRDIILKTKIKEVHHIIIDQSYFSKQIDIPGRGDSLNPYDAPIGALCANFNTIMFQWDSQKKQFVSGEPQTPLLDFFHDDIRKTNLKQGRIILSQEQSYLYPGLLLKYFLEKKMVPVKGSVLLGDVSPEEKKTNIYISPHGLKNVIQRLLQYSNNFIANQLFLSMGAKVYGAPATIEKGVRVVTDFANQHLKLNALVIDEGSGLSKSNRISPDQMIKLLINFKPYHELMRCEDNDFFKTGTLTGVRTRAGYLVGKDDRLYPYVIMVNEENKGYEPILNHLKNMVRQAGGKL